MSLLQNEIIDDDSLQKLAPAPAVLSNEGGAWSTRTKLLAALLALALYAYALLFFKTLYLREYRIERITNSMEKTAEMMESLYAKDKELASNILSLRAQSYQ